MFTSVLKKFFHISSKNLKYIRCSPIPSVSVTVDVHTFSYSHVLNFETTIKINNSIINMEVQYQPKPRKGKYKTLPEAQQTQGIEFKT